MPDEASDEAGRISMEASDWLVRLREAPDDAALHRAFSMWRDAHPDHGRIWGEMQALFDLIGQVEPAHPACLAPVPPRDHPAMAMGRARRFRPGWRASAMAAVAACLALLIGPDLILRLQADHLTPAGQLADVQLADGSHVRLGPDSAIAVDYRRERRDIRLLKGQAWFDVAPDRTRPFNVRADDVTATALGTAFDVRMIGTESSVAVAHGRVRVEDDGAATRQAHLLNPGDWVGIAADHQFSTGHQAADLAGIWQSGSVIIRGKTVAQAIDELRPWYAGRIVLTDAAIGRKRVTGIFRLSDPQEALRALIQPHGGQIVQITPWLMIVTS